jgi:type I restriction enzyme M protein
MRIPDFVWNDLIEIQPEVLKNRGSLAKKWGSDAVVEELLNAGHLREQGGRVARTKSSVYAAALWEVLPEDGSSIGNQRARQDLRWTSDRRYEVAKGVLLSTGEIVLGRGRGGSLRRALPDESGTDDAASGAETRIAPRPSEDRKRSAKPADAPVTASNQRAELHKTIWRIANQLRGSVDGWDFKSYVLGMLFYRFISENLVAYINEGERLAGAPDFDYTTLDNEQAEFGRKETVAEKGFYILPSELFTNVRMRAPHDANLNETLEAVFKNIEGSAVGTDSEDDLKGLFDDLDVNSSKLGNTVAKRNAKLVNLLDAIGDLSLGSFSNHTIDAFGDAYEFLMTMYASQAGKSGGEFFTPQEVSELLARITVLGKTEVNKAYDPACGSGSLLLKFAKVLPNGVRQGFFGQEINLATYNLCRINMFLHDINYEKFDIAHGDTLVDPAHWDDEPFEAIVSNPPYSIRWEGDANPLLINDSRYSAAGVLAPRSKADLAFTMHILSWLAVNGTAAIVQFPGVLYRGGAEQKIRQYLIENNYVDAVIQLPPDLFFGTTIATCIIVLKKSKSDNKTLFIDASAEFVRQGNKNKLTEANQRKIVDAFAGRRDVDYLARLVDNRQIAENKYNIAVGSYVEAADTRAVVDITALNAQIARIVARQVELRSEIDAIVADLEGDQA